MTIERIAEALEALVEQQRIANEQMAVALGIKAHIYIATDYPEGNIND